MYSSWRGKITKNTWNKILSLKVSVSRSGILDYELIHAHDSSNLFFSKIAKILIT